MGRRCIVDECAGAPGERPPSMVSDIAAPILAGERRLAAGCVAAPAAAAPGRSSGHRLPRRDTGGADMAQGTLGLRACAGGPRGYARSSPSHLCMARCADASAGTGLRAHGLPPVSPPGGLIRHPEMRGAGATVAPRSAGGRLAVAALAGLCMLAGCGWSLFPDGRVADARGTGEFRMVGSGAAWVNAPQAMAVLQESGRSSARQRVLLPNPTPDPGDNALYMRVFRHSGTARPPLRARDILLAAGEFPRPFNRFDEEGLHVRDDEAGTLLWLQHWHRGVYVCVLAARRIGIEQRVIPQGGDVLDVVLRHCVASGDPEDALRPISAQAVLFPTGSRAGGGLTLSPFAAPMNR